MKLRLLIVSSDKDYVDHLSRVLTEKHEGVFEVTICTATERLAELQGGKKFDIALVESSMNPTFHLIPTLKKYCPFLLDPPRIVLVVQRFSLKAFYPFLSTPIE